jgi:hypothetical protein
MPFGWYVMGSVACAAVSPMIATVVLGRELTLSEAIRRASKAQHTAQGRVVGAMLQVMLVNANGRGIVLIAAVGNSGPRSPPLYPAADPGVIGVTATDARDRLMPTRPDLPDGVPVFGPVTVAGTSHPPVSSMRSLWLTQPANSRRGEQSAGRRAPINFVDRLPWSRRIP